MGSAKRRSTAKTNSRLKFLVCILIKLVSTLIKFYKHLSALHLRANFHIHRLHGACKFHCDAILHFHSFHHTHGFAGFECLTGLYEHLSNGAGKGCFHHLCTKCRLRCGGNGCRSRSGCRSRFSHRSSGGSRRRKSTSGGNPGGTQDGYVPPSVLAGKPGSVTATGTYVSPFGKERY